ncbi:hypothetical protein Thermus77927_24780 [Thermus hydrothermalis]
MGLRQWLSGWRGSIRPFVSGARAWPGELSLCPCASAPAGCYLISGVGAAYLPSAARVASIKNKDLAGGR